MKTTKHDLERQSNYISTLCWGHLFLIPFSDNFECNVLFGWDETRLVLTAQWRVMLCSHPGFNPGVNIDTRRESLFPIITILPDQINSQPEKLQGCIDAFALLRNKRDESQPSDSSNDLDPTRCKKSLNKLILPYQFKSFHVVTNL